MKPKNTIRVGGEEVALKPLPPVEWARATQELPEFLLRFAVSQTTPREDISVEQLEEICEKAKRWVQVCAKEEGVKVEDMTVPEALEAVAVIAQMNGLDAQLMTFFRQRFQHQPN
ncbi:hypothetical protein [Deinococcus cellulosilyticus]|uniref:Uncharacterized protein n=1 Tax=Deinococcus cellulosilyticus (strain DSM 18568 / NBRC 106333 / KACC 11606 / 5516J-15) TaxID=1223518 RepID=A0A511N2Y1_DEIC1|nr:hypothetical protein [Deinococcus cellulosilyticus]GEM47215.1 hypothetical protein DC3_28500 [Deinococcus cellulosilyticus NBRC 106333 = KACC 11606]